MASNTKSPPSLYPVIPLVETEINEIKLDAFDIKCPNCKKHYSADNVKCPICNPPKEAEKIIITKFARDVPSSLQIAQALKNQLKNIKSIKCEIVDCVINEVSTRCLRLWTLSPVKRVMTSEKVFYFNNENDLIEMTKLKDEIIPKYSY